MVADIILKLALVNDIEIQKWVKQINYLWFESQPDRIIWKEITKVIKQYGSIPSLPLFLELIKAETKEPEQVIVGIEDRIKEVDKINYSEIDKNVVSKLIGLFVEKQVIRKMLEESALHFENDKVEQIWDVVEKTRINLGKLKNGKEQLPILDEAMVLERYIHRNWKDEEGDVGLLLPSLDRVLKGGLKKGTLSVVLGVTSIGKTMFLVYCSAAVALQGEYVLYISLEDTKEIIDGRFDSLWFGSDLINKVLNRRSFLVEVGGNVFTEFGFDMSVSNVEVMWNLYKDAGIKIGVVVIDYGDLLKSGERHKEEHQELGDVFEKLMKFAERENIIIITASQANREALGRKVVTLKNMGRSFRKAQVAHYVFALSQTDDEEEKGIIRLVVLKNKFGRRNITIPCKVDRARQFFSEAV